MAQQAAVMEAEETKEEEEALEVVEEALEVVVESLEVEEVDEVVEEAGVEVPLVEVVEHLQLLIPARRSACLTQKMV